MRCHGGACLGSGAREAATYHTRAAKYIYHLARQPPACRHGSAHLNRMKAPACGISAPKAALRRMRRPRR